MKDESLFGRMEGAILKSSMTEEEKHTALQVVLQDKNRKANILITGAVGCGKSSTINALFRMEQAKVGTGIDPETMTIQRFELGNLTLWDSPGFGDEVEADKRYAKGIIDKLNERDEKGYLLIDVVLVLIDGRIRDLGTSYELINKVIIPQLQDDKRLLIGINKADMAMKGKNWDSENSKPLPILQKFLDEKADSVQRRIKEATGVDVEPICYSAGYKEEGQEQEKPYNLSKLLCYIINRLPKEKRLPVLVETNQNKAMWQSNDELKNYGKEIRRNVGLDVLKSAGIGASSGAMLGAAIGSFIPVIGTAIGAAVGGIGGAVVGAVGEFLDDHCFITTATCKTLGKSDDCYELMAFRSFRDNWLVNQADGTALIAEYYNIAPKIVAAINTSPQSLEVYQDIWEDHLSPCLQDIETKNYSACKAKYTAMVNSLRQQYGGNSSGSTQTGGLLS